jgi:hypothetical protein
MNGEMGDDAAASKVHGPLDGGTADRNILYRLAYGFSVCTGRAANQASARDEAVRASYCQSPNSPAAGRHAHPASIQPRTPAAQRSAHAYGHCAPRLSPACTNVLAACCPVGLVAPRPRREVRVNCATVRLVRRLTLRAVVTAGSACPGRTRAVLGVPHPSRRSRGTVSAPPSGLSPVYRGNSGFRGNFWLLWLPFSSV